MSEQLKISLLSPERIVAELSATSLKVPAFDGLIEVLPGHTAMLSKLGSGGLEIRGIDAGEEEEFFISGGYLEVVDNKVKILVDVVERVGEIDLERAERSRKRAEERLKDQKADIARALAALERAKARQRLVESLK